MGTRKVASGNIAEEAMKTYGNYVLEERALADLRDGLKPVQRRVLWTVWERLKLRATSTPKKSARVTGETCGLYHPHGDVAVYQTMVNMTWDNYALIAGVGNFGDPPSKKPPAAARYTAVRATPLLVEVFKDRPVTPMVPNYSGEVLEPQLIPSRVPSLLLNGSEGIAVGTRSCIPPHNLEEVVRAALKVLKNPNTRLSTLLKIVKGPDYGCGGKLVSKQEDIKHLYETGNGSLAYECHHSFDKAKNGYTLTVTSAAPNWNVPAFVVRCEKLRARSKIGWVSNESGENIKVVVFSRDKDKLTQFVVPLLRTKINYNWVALDQLKPVTLTLVSFLTRWVDFRRRVTEAHIQHKLKVLRKKLRSEQARLAAVQNLETTIGAIRSSKPLAALQSALGLTPFQAKVILRSSIRLLTRVGEREQLQLVKDLKSQGRDLKAQLGDIDGTVAKQLRALLKSKLPRKTEVA